jgi:DnaJ-class molecular chaperone with C-terminal Zn finger domain
VPSPYETLGVAKNASQDEIKKAYRKLVREVHPDRNPGSEERFKEVQNAYDVLSDPEKRKEYDQFGSANGRGPGGGGPGATTFDFGDFDLGDIFGGMFGGGRGARPQRGQRGNDVEVEVTLSFEDALQGVKTTVPVSLELACHTCHGTGAAPGTAPITCPRCGGSGQVATSQGLFALQQPCPLCHGMGTIVETPCPTCHGTGRERRTKRYTVTIPAGVKDGTRIKLKGRARPATAAQRRATCSSSRVSSRQRSTSAAATTSSSTSPFRTRPSRSAATSRCRRPMAPSR